VAAVVVVKHLVVHRAVQVEVLELTLGLLLVQVLLGKVLLADWVLVQIRVIVVVAVVVAHQQ
jgi:hypothetical protein